MDVSIDIKTELKQLIEKESDTSILKAIRTLLTKTSLDSSLKAKLSKRALQSEDDIAKERLMDKDEIRKRMDDYLTK
tara:strand:+ start:341 stop:571 length:231 start_codon:yes stop_codon:yes gene_type:complete